MDLLEKIKAVEEEFQNLDREISSFQSWSGLGCKVGCGKCCFKPDIEATVLEFLPFAQYLHEQDKAFEWLEKDLETRNGLLQFTRWLVQFEPLRSDPRFRDMLKRMGLPE